VAAGIAKSPVPDGVLYRKDTGGGPIAVTHPNGGETFHVGETVTINWTADLGLVPDALIQVSPDDGENWCIINQTQAVLPTDASWGKFEWTIPDSMQGEGGKVGLASTKCLLRVQTYSYEYPDVSDSWFTIVADAPVAALQPGGSTQHRGFAVRRLDGGELCVSVPDEGAGRVEFVDVNGRIAAALHVAGGRRYIVGSDMLSRGVRLVRLCQGQHRKVMVLLMH
jgi:hypothetical protein